MVGGPKKHLKRIATPANWYLSKMDGIYAPRPSAGPHKLRDCIPLAVLLRNKLKYALTYDEVKMIVMQKLIKIDGKVRTDKTFPLGFMDVVSIEKTNEFFRILFDAKGRFVPHRISHDEANFKLCRVRKVVIGKRGIPYAYLHDGRTVRYIHPDVKVNDTLKLDLSTNAVLDHLKFEIGALAMVTSGRSIGRVGKITLHEKHDGTVDLVTMMDARGEVFSTKVANVFIIGKDNKSLVTLPKGKGIRKSILEEQQQTYSKSDKISAH